LESRLNKLNQNGPKIICRSEKETFFPEIQQQWKQQQLNISATDFIQEWNFLGRLQAPTEATLKTDDLNQADSDLDDVEDFTEADPNQDGCALKEPEPGLCRRKLIRTCRHKLQTRAYPRTMKKKTRQSTKHNLDPEDQDLQQEWLQLIQVEREIEKRKNQLREAEAGYQGETELEDLLLDEADEELGHLDDEDLEWVESIFNSSNSQTRYSQNSDQRKLKSAITEDAPTRTRAAQAPPSKFNQNFNQNSMTLSNREDDFSYFPNTDYEGDGNLGDYFSDDEEEETQSVELGDYFSDDEEDDSLDYQNSKSENNFWSRATVLSSEEKLPPSLTAFSGWNPVISSLEAFERTEPVTPGKHLAGFLEANQLGFATWQPFIPHGHVFQNSAAPSQLSDFSSQAFSSQEPTHIQIATISTLTRLEKNKTSPRRGTPHGPLRPWRSSRRPTRRPTNKWTKPWTRPKEVCEVSPNWQKECPDPLEQSNLVKHWTKQPPFSGPTNQNRNSSCQITPPVNDKDGNEIPKPEATNLQQQVHRQERLPNGSSTTSPPHYFRSLASPQSEQPYTWHQESDAPNVHQAYTHFKLQTYWNTRPVRSIARTKYWGKRLLKSSIKTPTFRTKLPSRAKRHRKNSKRIQLWHWSQKPFLPICSLSTAKTHKSYQKNKTYPPGGSHFSKRRSESENTNYHQQGKNYDQCQKVTSKNDTQSESDDVTVKSEENLKTMTKIDDEAKTIARDDEVKAITKTLKEFRARKEKQIDRKIETRASITLPHPFATTSHISILTFTIFICTFNILIAIFNSLVPDPLDQHSQTFTIGDLSDCKLRHLSQQTASNQADTVVKTLANPDSIRPFKIPGTWPEVHYKNRFRNPLVPSHLTPDRVRKSEIKFYHVSCIFHYLDFSR
jgi:hypothetical protein